MKQQLRLVALLALVMIPMGVMGQPTNYFMIPSFGPSGQFTANMPTSGVVRRQFQATSTNNTFHLEWDSQWNEWYNTSINYGTVFTLTFEGAAGLTRPSTLNQNPTVGRFYTFQIDGFAYSNRLAVFMETDNEPVSFAASNPVVRDKSTVYAGQDVTVTVNFAAGKSSQERAFVRYTTNNFTSSEVAEVSFATSTSSTGTATIPASIHAAGTSVIYYVYTTTVSSTSSTEHDLVTLRLSNNGGSNFSYTVQSWATAQAGNWSTAATWAANAVPSTTANLGSVTIGHNVTLDQEAYVTTFTINNGVTFTASDASERTLHVVRSASGSATTFTNNGVWANGTGGSIVRFTGAPSSGDAVHSVGGSGTTAFQEVRVSKTSGSSNVGASFASGTSVVDALRISGGGYIASAPPTGFYGANATLEFNTGGTYNVNAGDNTWSTSVIPNSIRILTGTVNVNQARSFNGTLTVESGATLVTNGNVTAQSGSNLLNNGNITGNITFQRTLTGSEGWRLLSSPVNGGTYESLLTNIWTQGATGGGGDTPSGSPNVMWSEGSTSSTFNATNVTNLSVAPPLGRGFAVYVYNDDNYSGEGGTTWPKTLSVAGAEHAAGGTYTPAHTGGTQYAIAGNPFATTINWNHLTRGSDVHNAVWVWNPATSTYDSYNTGNGNLTGGLIAPFQGFWIQYNGSSSGITFPAGAKSTGASFRGKDVVPSRVVVRATDSAGSNNAWISFNSEAAMVEDRFDAVKFTPLSADYIQAYTMVADKAHDINTLPADLIDVVEIPLGVTSTRGGSITLDLQELNLPGGWIASIRDNTTGEIRALDASFSYRYESSRAKAAPAGDAPHVLASSSPRFTLIIDPATSTSAENGKQTTENVHLEQNYPNPFNPSTVIRWQLAVGGKMRLSVYDVLGREVAVLVDGVMAAGSHSVTFDASPLTSGVYLYKLEAGGMSQVRRMTLVK